MSPPARSPQHQPPPTPSPIAASSARRRRRGGGGNGGGNTYNTYNHERYEATPPASYPPPAPPAAYYWPYPPPASYPPPAPPSFASGNGGPAPMTPMTPPALTPPPPSYAPPPPASPPPASNGAQMEYHLLAANLDDLKRNMATVGADVTTVKIGMESMKGSIMPRAEITAEINHRVHEDVFEAFKTQMTTEITTLRNGPTRMVSFISLGISTLMAVISLILYLHH